MTLNKLMNNFKYYNVNINLITHDLQLLKTSISWFNVPTYKPNAHHQKILQLRDRCASKMRDAVWIFSYSGVVWVHDPQPHHLDHVYCHRKSAGKIRRGRCILKRFKMHGVKHIFIDCIIVFFPDLEKALPVNIDNWLQSHQSKYESSLTFIANFSNFQEHETIWLRNHQTHHTPVQHPWPTRINISTHPQRSLSFRSVHRNSRPNLRFTIH